MNINSIIKSLPQKGDLRYEYNPLWNFRKKVRSYKQNTNGWILLNKGGVACLKLRKECFLYPKEFDVSNISFYNYYETENKSEDYYYFEPLTNKIILTLIQNKIFTDEEFYSKAKDYLILEEVKNEITDLTTPLLDFDLNHPVDILTQEFYDGSVNLILNDDKNPTRIINSRFSVTEGDTYQIPQRLNDNDANLYDDSEWEQDTQLRKIYKGIPDLQLVSVSNGGNLLVGSYIFYFKYEDADGNTTDFIAESGAVALFIGTTESTVQSGFGNMNSNKFIEFKISNLDTSYKKIRVYYSRASSEIAGVKGIEYKEITKGFPIKDNKETIIITGFENTIPSSFNVINAKYQTWDCAKTQALLHNKLLIGNLEKQEVDHKDLIDLSARIYPKIIAEKFEDSYKDPLVIYNKLGYHPEEFYRFGIVYILNNNTLSDVYNVAGTLFDSSINKIKEGELSSELSSVTDKEAEYLDDIYQKKGTLPVVDYDGEFSRNYLSVIGDSISNTSLNNKGVIKMPECKEDYVLGVKLVIPKKVYLRLSKLTKGYFFVRQRRLPLVLGQGIIVGNESISHLPTLKNEQEDKYFFERFINNSGTLAEDFASRCYYLDKDVKVSLGSMYFPEAIINSKFYNQLFTGEEYVYKRLYEGNLTKSPTNQRYYIHSSLKEIDNSPFSIMNIINVNDGVKIVSDNHNFFSARAGEAEEAWRFSFIGKKLRPPKKEKRKGIGKIADWAENTWNNVSSWFKGEKYNPWFQHVNMVRGVYGPYCGISNYKGKYGDKVNVYVNGYSPTLFKEYYSVRKNDKSEYYPICERKSYVDIKTYGLLAIDEKNQKPCYRGDCYINTFTHRIYRNFIDPETTLNDDIVANDTWSENFKQGDLESCNKIVRGDVNAVPLGLWITFNVRSTLNLDLRGEDLSNENEYALFGRGRQWYPLAPLSTKSVYKIPESFIYNDGFRDTLSHKYNYLFPEVPYIRNEFNTRIVWSNSYVSDAFQNGYRVFNLIDKVDYPKELGSITKIMDYGGAILCVFDHGIAVLKSNPNNDTDGSYGEKMTTASPFLSEYGINVISDMYGSKWKDSICMSENWVYGVDTVAKKIWRTNGQEVDILSERGGIQSFLNHNIDLSERDIVPIEGLRNVKTHYNAFKKDLMFTFYNGTRGVQEIAWNICFNEYLNQFITFYSWLPSASCNIDNMYFSFNRKVTKWIAKIANCSEKYKPANGLILSNVTIDEYYLRKVKHYLDKTCDYYEVIKEYSILPERRRELQEALNTKESLEDEIRRYENRLPYESGDSKKKLQDSIANCKSKISALIQSTINPLKERISILENRINSLTLDFNCELNYRNNIDPKLKPKTFSIDELDPNARYFKVNNNKLEFNLLKYLIDFGVDLSNISDSKSLREEFKRVYYKRKSETYHTRKYMSAIFEVNMQTDIMKSISPTDSSIVYNGNKYIDVGKETKKIAVTLECLLDDYTRDSLFSTDFWKHGQAGLFDLQDDLKPTHWYGEQHPFEVEFCLNKDISVLKAISNLVILSNNSEPESFHFTVVGDHYDWSQDKPNIYFRQEATKALLQRNGYDISYDKNFRMHPTNQLIKSTYLLKEYERQDSLDELYDTYYNKLGYGYDYGNRTGGEIGFNNILKEYYITINQKCISIDGKDASKNDRKNETGRLRGNTHYKNGAFYVEVRPMYITQKNEDSSDWKLLNKPRKNIPPIILPKSGFVQEILDISLPIEGYSLGSNIYLMDLADELYTDYPGIGDADNLINKKFYNVWSYIKSARISDKYIKIRIRYSGKKLTILNAITSIYNTIR